MNGNTATLPTGGTWYVFWYDATSESTNKYSCASKSGGSVIGIHGGRMIAIRVA